MTPSQKQYLVIDLKSFYASVECVERGLDPMKAKLVVADLTRTEKTICLAVSPALRALGVPGRCRVFEIPKNLTYEVAPPRMALYVERSADVYSVYLKYIAPEDIHVYSIDEAFIDVTPYLSLYGCTARELGEKIRADVAKTTGIPATCGLGPNLYLAKIALDITAKHSPNFFGELDEESYKLKLWNHKPLTDFWHIGAGIQKRLAAMNRDTEGARLIFKEMVEALSLELVTQKLVCSSIGIYIGYSATESQMEELRQTGDYRSWRRHIPSSSGTRKLSYPTNSRDELMAEVLSFFDERVIPSESVHRVGLTFGNTQEETGSGIQTSLFQDNTVLERERQRQDTINAIKKKFGKNSLLKAMDLLPEATARQRNAQIGGHRSGEETNEA
ncbi:MAG: DNA repair protein [Atopobium sp.]|nr:DNA repair protein [Atopobium sp.]